MKKYLTDYPHLMQEFHFGRNGDLKPESLTHGSDKKVWWKCSIEESHEWDASVSHRTNGRGCPYCSGHRSNKQIREKKLNKAGWVMLDEYKNNSTKAKFQCIICYHETTSAYAHILSGHKKCRCQRYERIHRKWSEEARKRGGELLTPFYIGGRKTNYRWQCKIGHQWDSTPASVIEQKSWCNECRGYRERTFEELKEIVSARGGILLTDTFLGSEGNYEFRCNLGHYFSNGFRHIVDRGQWCPTCSKGRKSEEMVRTAMEQIFQEEFPKIRPKWLKNARQNQMELDGFNKNLKIGFEYQGEQHFRSDGLFFDKNLSNEEREKILEIRINDDKIKMELCKKNNVKLFILTYEDAPDDFQKIIEKQATEYGIQIDKYNFTSPIDFEKSYIREDRLDELKSLLSRKKIRVLSNKWIATDTKYKLKCEICDYEWSARGNAFFNTRRVAGCRKCAHKKNIEGQKLGIEVLSDYAKKFDGKVLSKIYVRRNHEYEFECKEGHRFKKNFNNMVYRKQFCPLCVGLKKS